ncbi:hypothetical protein GGR52DRAFT_564001 [Hypoxylon sp. FL1284]|nr:hypothetical protein GGR52DRAFT_564001 [Hypoxylon sp. FL1284]
MRLAAGQISTSFAGFLFHRVFCIVLGLEMASQIHHVDLDRNKIPKLPMCPRYLIYANMHVCTGSSGRMDARSS